MANTIRLKRGSGSDPSASDLVTGELAVRTDTGKIFTKKDNGSVVDVSGAGGNPLTDGDKGDITVSNGGDTFTIDNNAVGAVKIADGAVQTAKIADSAITNAKITNASIQASTKLIDGSISEAKLATASVTNAKIADGSISNAKVASNAAIAGSKLQAAGLVNAGSMSAANFNKLAGIEANATADMTGSEILSTISGENIILGEISSTGNSSFAGNVTISSSDGGVDAAPELDLYRISASPADSDYLGQIKFSGESDDGSKEIYAKITGKIGDASSGTEDGILEIAHRKAGSNNISARFTSTDLKLINGTGLEVAGNTTLSGNLEVNNFTKSTNGYAVGATTVINSSRELQNVTLNSNSVTATTQSAGNNTTRIATTAFVSTAISNLINGAPSALDTLNELAAAMNDDAAFSTTVTNSLATKMPLAGGEFTGNITFSGSQTVDGRDLSVDGAKLDGIESGATADQTASEILTLIKTVDGAGSGLNADLLDGVSSASFLRSDTADTMSANLTINARLDIGNGGGNDTEIRIYKADNNVSDHIQFYNGSTRVGEIGVHDDTWLRINNETSKNIFTPRYIRADGGFFVDGTSKGINGSGNFIGGTIAGASDYSTLLRSDANDTTTGTLTLTTSSAFPIDINGSSDAKIRLKGSSNPYIQFTESSTNRAYIQWSASADTLIIANEQSGEQIKLGSGSNGLVYRVDNSDKPVFHEGNLTVGDGGLTQNNFTNTLKSKLDGIASGATNVTNNNQLTNGAGYITATLTNEQVQDIVGGMVTGNTESGITVTYQDSDGTLDFSVGTLNQNTSGNAGTATKLQTARTIAGVPFDGSANISLNNNAITNGAGYLTSVGTSNISNNAVTFAKIQDIAQNRIIGRVASGSGDATTLTAANVRSMINVADGATNNGSGTVVPNSGGTFTGNVDFSSGIDVTGATTLTRSNDNQTTAVITNNGVTAANSLKLTSGGTAGGTQIFSVFRNNQSSEEEVFRIDGAGRVGIGGSADTKLHMKSSSNFGIRLTKTAHSDAEIKNTSSLDLCCSSGGSGGQVIRMLTGGNPNSLTEGLRMDGSRKVLIGMTSQLIASPNNPRVQIYQQMGIRAADNGNSRTAVVFQNPAGRQGFININSSSITIVGTSDYRVKKDVNYSIDGISKIKQVKPCTFKFIADEENLTVHGFLAHELQAVLPEAVTGEKDEVVTQAKIDTGEYEQTTLGDPIHQGVDAGKLIPLLTKALQEIIGKVEVLETEVAALKAS